MLAERWQKVETLYHSARERKPEERHSYLESACNGDEEIISEVESLLANDELAAQFLETDEGTIPGEPEHGSVPTGVQIGPYVILEFLRAGGMATPTFAPTTPPMTPTSEQPAKIVPKGLRSFDAGDADFFLELLPGPVR